MRNPDLKSHLARRVADARTALIAGVIAAGVAVFVTAGIVGHGGGEVTVHNSAAEAVETTTTTGPQAVDPSSTTTATAAPTVEDRVTNVEQRVTVIEKVITTTTTLPPGPPVPEGCARTQSGWTCPPPLPSPVVTPLHAQPHPGGVTVTWERSADPDHIVNYEVSIDGGPRQAATCCSVDIGDTPGTTVDVWAWRNKSATAGERVESGPRRYTVPKITSLRAELRNNNVVVTLTGVGEVPAGSVTVRISYGSNFSGPETEIRTMSYSAFTGETTAWYPPRAGAVAVELITGG